MKHRYSCSVCSLPLMLLVALRQECRARQQPQAPSGRDGQRQADQQVGIRSVRRQRGAAVRPRVPEEQKRSCSISSSA